MNSSSASTRAQADRRQQLIEAAISTIAHRGLSRTTLERVTRAAGMSPGIVGFYFKSKDALLLATLQYLSDEYSAAIQGAVTASGDDPLDVLHRIIGAHFDPVIATPAKVAAWCAFWGETRARNEYIEVCGGQDSAFSQTLDGLFHRLAQAYPAEAVDVDAITRGFDGLLDGLWQDLLADPENFDRDHAENLCRRFLASIFPGLSAATPLRSRSRASAPETSPTMVYRATLAPWTYQNDELLELEIEHLLRPNWQLVGHASELERSGDYLSLDILNERVLVIRGGDGGLRAFHNVCRHRGSRVVTESVGHCKRAIVCPFHGWTYSLDGTLKNVPERSSFADLDPAEHSLAPVEMQVWSGLMFVRFATGGPDVETTLGPATQELARYRIQDMVPLYDRTAVIQHVNWKLVHDIDNESYHVPIGHPGLYSLFGGRDGVGEDFGDDDNVSVGRIQEEPSAHWSVRMYQKLLPRFEHLSEQAQRRWFYVGLFPNHSFGFYPDSMEYFQTFPLTVDKTLYVYRAFGLPDERREVRAVRYLNQRINRQVALEDESFVRWVQEAMQSSAFPEPVLSSIEQGISHAHREIQKRLPVASLDEAPMPGSTRRLNDELLAAASTGHRAQRAT